MKKGGRYRVRQGLGTERQLKRESLQRATAEFIFPIFCPKLVFATSISPLPSPNITVCHAQSTCCYTRSMCIKNLNIDRVVCLNTWQHWCDPTTFSFHWLNSQQARTTGLQPDKLVFFQVLFTLLSFPHLGCVHEVKGALVCGHRSHQHRCEPEE